MPRVWLITAGRPPSLGTKGQEEGAATRTRKEEMCREVNLKQAVTFGMKTQPPEGTLQEGGGEIDQ